MALFRVSNERAQFDAAGNDARDQYGAGIRFTQGGNARVTTGSATNYNQGIPMSATGQVAIVDATAGLPAGTIFHNGLPISGDKVCVSRNATAVVSNGTPYDSAGAVAADINLDLNFIGTDTLNSSVTFTRASSATFVGSNGLIQSATTNTPRFDYDPVTLAAKGLLIEEQRTNLLTYSEQFDNAAWVKQNSSVVANATIAPNGTLSAYKLNDTTTLAQHRLDQTPVSSAGVQTLSVYAKAAEFGYVGLRIGLIGAGFNLSNGTVSELLTGATASVQSLGNGWYRCIVTCTAAANDIARINIADATSSAPSYAGTGTSGIFIWGAQLEAGSFATSYIPTVASQVTRSADVASVNTLIPWYNATEGTLYAEALTIKPTASGSAIVVEVNDTTLANRNIIFYNSAVIQVRTTVNNVTQVDINQAYTPNQIDKLAYAIKTNDFAFARNGAIVGIDAIGVVPTVSRMDIAGNTGSANLNGHIRRITYYPRRLSNAELQAITA